MTDDERRDVVYEYVTANTSGDSVVVLVFVVKDGRVASQHGLLATLVADNAENVKAVKRMGHGLEIAAETIMGKQ